MTPEQRAICRDLLQLSYEGGFAVRYPLARIVERLGIEPGPALYDPNTETGVLWELGEKGSDLLDVSADGLHAAVVLEMRDLVEAWSREPVQVPEATSAGTRAKLVTRAERVRREIEQIFLDAEHWNRLHSDEESLDADPDGQLARMLAGLKRVTDQQAEG